ncbi:MarR family winged helix-turn-helix transcriptional regulator [Streptosporangium sp. NPDC050855]|uniref:MarR family winged helix-turn-helix transcriptional regulator n=1 Tax=Streptosporangium sp. NPDC050855 TaxID=3366194 RepID=UPI0037BB64DC
MPDFSDSTGSEVRIDLLSYYADGGDGADDEGLTIGDLARSAGVSSRNVTGLVDTLERDGLVRRVPGRRDRRSVLVRITPAGRAWIDAFRRPTQAAMAAIFQGFTRAELTGLRHLCLLLADNQHRVSEHLGRALVGRPDHPGDAPGDRP